MSDCRSIGRETEDPWFASSIRTRSHTFAEIDHELISTAILLPFADLRMVVVSYKRKYVHKELVGKIHLALNAPIATKGVCFSRLLKC